jgi:ATP-dependent Clp protease protease subunit
MKKQKKTETEIEKATFDDSNYFLVGGIENDTVMSVVKWIYEANENDKVEGPINLYINSEGGQVCDAYALIDVMRSSRKPVATIGLGVICSAAFMILAAGAKGHRKLGKNTSVMMHQLNHDWGGNYADLKSLGSEIDYHHKRMIKILEDSTGLDKQGVQDNFLQPTDRWFTSQEAVKLGVVDKIF